jgi:GrxC family glutaredoxin
MSVKMYTTNWCPYCRFAKRLLNEKGVDFKEINIDVLGLSREDLAKITGGMTVPQIVINNEAIGGYDNLWALDQSGELDKKLK